MPKLLLHALTRDELTTVAEADVRFGIDPLFTEMALRLRNHTVPLTAREQQCGDGVHGRPSTGYYDCSLPHAEVSRVR